MSWSTFLKSPAAALLACDFFVAVAASVPDACTCSSSSSTARAASAGAVGTWLAAQLGPTVLRWFIGVGFIGMAAWMLIPDTADGSAAGGEQRFGLFGTTLLAFFLAEMGDKTQIATVALAARYDDLVPVVAGTTMGMLLADVPAVLLGDTIAKKVSMPLVHGKRAVKASCDGGRVSPR